MFNVLLTTNLKNTGRSAVNDTSVACPADLVGTVMLRRLGEVGRVCSAISL